MEKWKKMQFCDKKKQSLFGTKNYIEKNATYN